MKINLTNRNTVGKVVLTTGSAPLTGASGSQGTQGSQGFQGVQGAQGAQGSQGLPGTAVSKGDKGEQGFQGIQGAQGFQGEQGSQGLPGTAVGKGDKGDVGAQGSAGSKGDKGDVGAQGSSGSSGSSGAQGAAGAKGDKGDVGAQGSAGSKGDKGDVGAQGSAGLDGAQGATGSKGDKGDAGAQGIAGSNGAQGVAGLNGAQGAAGSKGDKGDQGTAGLDGAQGATGSKGDKGDIGTQGIQGAAGDKGSKGDDVNSIAAFNQANSAYSQANSAYSQANSAYDQANAAYTQANTANDNANTRVLKAGDTMTGNLNVAATIISQNIVPDLDVTYDLGTPEKRFRDLYLSGATLYLGNTQVSTTANDEIAVGSLSANSINLAGYNVQTWVDETTERANLKVQTINTLGALSIATTNASNIVIANISVRTANTTQNGVVQLSDDLSNTSVSLAATANSVNAVSELADATEASLLDLTSLVSQQIIYTNNFISPTLNLAANTVRVSANGGSTLSKQQLNFTNTADVIVSVGAGAGAASGNANVGFTLSSTGVAAGTYGDATNVPAVTVDSKGRITNISNVAIASAGDAYNQANAAYAAANTKLPIAGGTITGDLTVSGNLAVLGDSTVLNVSVIKVEDNEIVLNSNVTGAPTLDALLTVNRGANANVALRWNETTDKWEWTDDGTTYTAFSSISSGAAYNQANAAYTQANSAYTQANAAYTQATNAYTTANNALPQSGGQLTGPLISIANKMMESGTGFGLDLNNSDITSLNGLYFNDIVNINGEGLNFYRDGVAWDSFYANNGILYFIPNRTANTPGTARQVWHEGNDGSGSGLDADTVDGIHGSVIGDAYNQANAAYAAANTANTTPVRVDNSLIGTRRTLDFKSANTSNLTISGTDDPTNNKVVLIFDNPKLGGSGVSAYGNTELYISDTPPGSANSNTALWWRANTGKFYIYYNDGDSTQWVSLTPSPIVNTSSNLFFSDANTAASIAAANTLYSEKANRSGDTFTGNVSILQNSTKLNVTSTLIESNGRLTLNASEYKVNTVTLSANTGATAAPAQTIVDVLPISDYRTVKYLIQIKSGATYHATEILVLHDGTTTYMTEYATITSGPSLGAFSTDIVGGNMRLIFDPVYAVNTLNISRISMPA